MKIIKNEEIPNSVKEAYKEILHEFGPRKNTTGVEIGFKRQNGVPIEELSIRLLVGEKIGLETLGSTAAPSSVNDVPVDVIQFRPRLHSRRRSPSPSPDPFVNSKDNLRRRKTKFDPIVPGISCGNFRITAGTLGLFVYDNLSGKPGILSNFHVLFGSSGKVDDAIFQPATLDGGTDNSKIAISKRHVIDQNLDAAFAELYDGISFINIPFGVSQKIDGVERVCLGQRVKKSGRTTGITEGIVEGYGAHWINYGGRYGTIPVRGFSIGVPPEFQNQDIEISMGGDSGSGWFGKSDVSGRTVWFGLHYGGEADPNPKSEIALACHMDEVLDMLDVSLTPPSLVESSEPTMWKALYQESSKIASVPEHIGSALEIIKNHIRYSPNPEQTLHDLLSNLEVNCPIPPEVIEKVWHERYE